MDWHYAFLLAYAVLCRWRDPRTAYLCQIYGGYIADWAVIALDLAFSCARQFLAAYGGRIALVLEVLLVVISASWFSYHIGWYGPAPTAFPLNRAQQRHQVCNVFIIGPSMKGTLLRVPFGASASWVVHELERRLLVRRDRAGKRLSYSLLLHPGDGSLPRLLHRYQDLLQAGMRNNSTIEVRYCLRGGAGNAEAGPSRHAHLGSEEPEPEGAPPPPVQPSQAEPPPSTSGPPIETAKNQCKICLRQFANSKGLSEHHSKARAGSRCRPKDTQNLLRTMTATLRRIKSARTSTARTSTEPPEAPTPNSGPDVQRANDRMDVDEEGSGMAGIGAGGSGGGLDAVADVGGVGRGEDGDEPRFVDEGWDGDGWRADEELDVGGDPGAEDVPAPSTAVEDEDLETDEEDPFGWSEEDVRRALERGKRIEDELFEEEEERENEEDAEADRARYSDDEEETTLETPRRRVHKTHHATTPPGSPLPGSSSPLDSDFPLPFNSPPPPNSPLPSDRDPTPPQDTPPPPDHQQLPPEAYPPPQDRTPSPEPEPSKRRIEKFGERAGEVLNPEDEPGDPYSTYEAGLADDVDPNNPYLPFRTKLDWDIASWAKTCSIGANQLTALLQIEGLKEKLGIQFSCNKALNEIIDVGLPPRSSFKRRTYELGGERLDMYTRDGLELLRELYGRPDFAPHLVFAPEKHFMLVGDTEERAYSEMHTGTWWWWVQMKIERKRPGATVVPLIISSDKTQLTLFRNRSAYPVYLTIGNIPKELRRKTSLQGMVLLGYLPVTGLKGIKNDDVRRRAQLNLFHTCLSDMVAPFKRKALKGVVMTSGDGARRRCHPILAAYVGDYPEQVNVAGVKYGHCPKGTIDPSLFGTELPCLPRDMQKAAAAIDVQTDNPGDAAAFVEACQAAGVKPITNPFWKDWAYVDIHQALQVDILHQLYQGVVKHLIAWLKRVYGEKAIDERFKCLPDNHQLRHFSKGISSMSRVSGTEHQDICRVLLGVITDLPLPSNRNGRPICIVKATRALLDFVYLAQAPEATETTLTELVKALHTFHVNKHVFKTLGAREHFKLPKLHALIHYAPAIRLFGTADNYNTAYSERLHIDYAKSAWRASNRKDEYPQMTVWLQRREQIRAHQAYIDWRQRAPGEDTPRIRLPRALKLKNNVAHGPSVHCLTFAKAESRYGAVDFQRVLTEYILKLRRPEDSDRRIARLAQTWMLPFLTVPAFHRLKFWHPDALEREGDFVPELPDSVIARPWYRDTQKRKVQGQFSTALVNEFDDGGHIGVDGYRVGQVRLIFGIPAKARRELFNDDPNLPEHFAYIEWFTPFRDAYKSDVHHMYRVKRDLRGPPNAKESVVSILPVDRIRRSVSLLPRIKTRNVPAGWNKDNILDKCEWFHVSPFSDRHAYITIK
ncbi:unnamed protein product [Peniophora sp. CBMAI 1063]|nr:unnamed protein product [Peniophora sp. CBMAI 1063]